MIIYNVTVTLNENIHSSWLEWLRQEHIPEVLSTRLLKRLFCQELFLIKN